MIDKPEGLCTNEKPHMEEPCNPEQCVYSDNPDIKANLGQDYMQTDPYLKVNFPFVPALSDSILYAGLKTEGGRPCNRLHRHHSQSSLPCQALRQVSKPTTQHYKTMYLSMSSPLHILQAKHFHHIIKINSQVPNHVGQGKCDVPLWEEEGAPLQSLCVWQGWAQDQNHWVHG